jgi:hypothetical protein
MARTRLTRSMIAGAPIPAGTGVTLLARLRGSTGQIVTTAQINSIAYTVTDLLAGETLGTGVFATTTVGTELIQRDPRWSADTPGDPGDDDASGYNFAATLPASLFELDTAAAASPMTANATRKIRCDVAFTPASGEAFRVSFEWEVQATYG